MSKTQKRPAAAKRTTPITMPAAAPASTDKHIPNLGDCLRAIRFKRRLSLADVSSMTGIARSTLSRVESNQLSLTYDKLVQLSRGLQIDLAELLSSGSGSQSQPTLTRRTFSAPDGGKMLTVGSSVYRYMCTELSAKRMTPMVAEVRAQSVEETNGLLAHPGEEFTYVLSGRVTLHTEFYAPLILEMGAGVYFDSTMRHTYVAMDGAPAQILCICSVDDQTIQHALAASNPQPLPTTTAKARTPRRVNTQSRAVRDRKTT